jgi:hypothetical protein
MRTRAYLAALVLAASSAALPCRYAAAQEKDAVTEMAKRRFQEGVKFFDQKRYEEARAAFLQAYALKHHPAVLLNLAQCELRSGHHLEAARHFSAYLRDPPANGTSGERSDAEKGLSSARAKLGRIQVSVTSGAEVLVDGENVGTSPLPEAVDSAPGNHTVEARLGGRSTSTSVTVTVGRSATATLSLEGGSPPIAPLPPPTGNTPPTAPAETPEGPPPSDASNASPGTADTSVQLSSASTGRQPFFTWLGHSGWGITGVVLTGVGIGTIAGFTIIGNQASDNVDSVAGAIQTEINKDKNDPAVRARMTPEGNYPVCADPALPTFAKACAVLKDDIDKRDLDRTVATAGIVVAVAGLTTVVAGYLLSPKTSSTKAAGPAPKVASQAPSVAVVPVIGAHESGLQILGRF